MAATDNLERLDGGCATDTLALQERVTGALSGSYLARLSVGLVETQPIILFALSQEEP